MASIIIPQKKQNPVGGLLPLVGSAVGTYYGGSAGGAAGGMVGEKLGGSINKPGPGAVESTAMTRRGESIDEDPYEAIRRARLALEKAPKDIQESYRQALDDALIVADRGDTY